MEKRFIIRKYIYAKDALEAIKKDKVTKVDEVWVDEDWKKLNDGRGEKGIGF
jgi:hypothetical protein